MAFQETVKEIIKREVEEFFKRDEDDDGTILCDDSNDIGNSNNMRVLALFIILISSVIGSYFPILSSRFSFVRLPDWCWFIAKFFGSGVIIATGFVHLLQPANEALSDPCLTGTLADYPWAFGICLMSLFLLFFSEIIAHYFVAKASGSWEQPHSHLGNLGEDYSIDSKKDIEKQTNVPGTDHYGHDESHIDADEQTAKERENYLGQVLAVFVLEFGVIFHSIFVGLTLAVTGEDEFNTLFIVLVFHQMFEGLGLGTRIAEVKWSHENRWTPWLLAFGYAISTPIAIAIGIGVRYSFVPGGRSELIANGVFDSISSGILIYTGLVELMAHEFLYSNQFKKEGGFQKMLLAFFIMCSGTGLMALLGKWA
ncbi:hypothetical protein WICMUC_002759 [Wickerhamomyces mucosus]|uniref:Uncharacterized protein n=1 Tax=Wickerhamomyces mucosus TaxID=1378264 RepID=A0A9P8TEC1_9ASCO|nr:hypothetical protein WICMUC_002759 [Wickerhamomyces mucosus]